MQGVWEIFLGVRQQGYHEAKAKGRGPDGYLHEHCSALLVKGLNTKVINNEQVRFFHSCNFL